MFSTTKNSLTICIFIVFALQACSNFHKDEAKQAYEEIQKIQEAAEQAMRQSLDYDIRLNSCENVINSLQTFLTTHSEGQWSQVAKTALMAWQSKREVLQKERRSLLERLYSLLQERAIEEANKAHGMSNMEEIRLSRRNETKDGIDIFVTDQYAVRMRGALLGIHIFKLEVTVSGRLITESKTVIVDEQAEVRE